MVKTLQKKFVFTAMIAVTILLMVLIGGINVANGWLNRRQTDRQLKMLLDREIQIMQQEQPEFLKEHFWELPIKESGREGSIFNPPMNEDTAMSLRFFVIRLDNKGQILHKDVSRIASVSEETAEEYAQKVVQKKSAAGYVEDFRYKVANVEDLTNSKEKSSKIIIFLDISRQFQAMLMVLVLSNCIGAGCWLFMLLLVISLSRKAIRPIAENIHKQKQFVTDAGHEIKTPLAIIQANIDAMELINGENKWSRNIRIQIIRLNGLMQNLLTLAKMEEGNHKLSMTNFSISELVEESLQPFYELAALREIRIESNIQPDTFLSANREYMQRLLSILLDNAVKYTNIGGNIVVSLKKENHIICLQVENTCEKLPEVDAEKLFDRFYRADSARTQKSGGYGIGLSAAKAITQTHNGTISAKYTEEGNIVFLVKISQLFHRF